MFIKKFYFEIKNPEYFALISDLLDLKKLKELKDYPSHSLFSKKVSNRFEHSIRVSFLSFKIALFLNSNIKICSRAGLLHDIGYKKDNIRRVIYETCNHAKRGYYIARKLGEDERICRIVLEHMFPLNRNIPSTLESLIVWFADKLDTILEVLGLYLL